VTFAEYNEEYLDFLQTGNEDAEPFLVLREYGPFDLSHPREFERFCEIVVTMIDRLQDLGPLLEEVV